MTQAIIYARVASQHSNLDTKIDNLVNYCSNHKLSIIKEYSICAKRKDTRYIKNLYEDVKALPNKHINIVAYSVNDLLPDTKMLELFDNLIKTGKVSLHFCRENLIYNSQTPDSEFVRLHAVVLFSQYHNIKSIPKENLQSLANEMYIRQMQGNIRANILKNQ
jgi:resolvase, N terminal domain